MIQDDASVVEPAFRELKANHLTQGTKDIAFRKAQLQSLLTGLNAMKSEFHQAFQKDLGYRDNSFFIDFLQMNATFTHIQDDIDNIYANNKKRSVNSPLLTAPAKSYILPEPFGVVLVIGAWNYPIFTCIPQAATAIAAGNCVVVKPSELSPNISNLLAKLFETYLDKRFYRVIQGAVNVAIKITTLPFDLIIFTGGTEKGKLVAKAAAENLTPCILELGGKSPCIIDESGDLGMAVRRVLQTKFMNLGQTCVAPDYILLQASLKDRFIALVKETMQQFFAEPQQSQELNRVINDFHTKRIAKLLENHGGDVIVGGKIDLQDKFIEPTVIYGPSVQSALMKEEIFGPILPVIEYKSITDAINFINSRDKPLALYYFGVNQNNKNRINNETSSGGTCINDCIFQLMNLELPFGGVGASGYGSFNGKIGFDQCSHLKSVLEKSVNDGVSARYPPYTHSKKKLLGAMTKIGHHTQQGVVNGLYIVIAIVVGLYLANRYLSSGIQQDL